jgi:hypothetical protein
VTYTPVELMIGKTERDKISTKVNGGVKMKDWVTKGVSQQPTSKLKTLSRRPAGQRELAHGHAGNRFVSSSAWRIIADVFSGSAEDAPVFESTCV